MRAVTSILPGRAKSVPVLESCIPRLRERGWLHIDKDDVASLQETDVLLVLVCAGYLKHLPRVLGGCRGEIDLLVWDLWPPVVDEFLEMISGSRCRDLHVAVRAVAERLGSMGLAQRVGWFPEAIDVREFGGVSALESRGMSVVEFGRRSDRWHESVVSGLETHGVRHSFTRQDASELAIAQHYGLFDDRSDFISGVKSHAVSICFPGSDTHPEGPRGGVPSMSARYLESLAAGCLIIGTAPAELLSLFGYNPLIDVDWSDPLGQVLSVLSDISQYQDLVDRNLAVVRKVGDWEDRLDRLCC